MASMARRRGVALAALMLLTASACLAVSAGGLAVGGGGTDATVIGNFEVGPPGWTQFSGLQFERDMPVVDSFGLVDDPVRSGIHAARITVRQGYSRFGYNEDTSLVYKGSEAPGDEYWYAFSVYFPRDWFPPNRWGIVAQWHANLGTSPIIGFDARADTMVLNFHAGLTNEQRNNFQFDKNIPLLNTLSKGKWNDFVMHVKWSTSDGAVEIWHRLAGEHRLRRLIRLTDVPTFQWTSSGQGYGTYLLFGLYRGSYCSQPTQLGCSSPTGIQPSNTLYLDSYARAKSFVALSQAAWPNERTVLCRQLRGPRLSCAQPHRGTE